MMWTGERCTKPLTSPDRIGGNLLVKDAGEQFTDLDSVVDTILVDAYGDDEQLGAFLTVFDDESELPCSATLLGVPVTVTGFEHDWKRGLVAICRSPQGVGEVSLADVQFPPDTVAAWIHAAYRHYLRLPPFPVRPRPDWTWPT